ncbi:MAG TPA: hypothetical protein PKB02_16600 [Anaerohalosphaeraceae bacterium]|nr:hypothetical protein [Anaerohalosphaeraceae bacterium]
MAGNLPAFGINITQSKISHHQFFPTVIKNPPTKYDAGGQGAVIYNQNGVGMAHPADYGLIDF